MRTVGIAVIAVGAALLGGVAALLLGDATGLTDGDTTTIVAPATQTTTSSGPPATAPPLLGNGFNPAAIYAARSAGVVTIYTSFDGGQNAQGSGFVVDGKGTIMTNAHVITNVDPREPLRGADRTFVEFKDGDRAEARIVGWDVFNDVGVIKVDPADHALAPVPLGDSGAVVVGAPVAAIGSPFGEQSSLSVGVVSATGRTIDSLITRYAVADAIQIDAPINHGNSGGPLFDARGRVIGINAQIRSNSGTAEGVGFAIPINTAKGALTQLERTGRVAYAYFGVTTDDLTPRLARRLGLGVARGALIVEVEADTPASRAGLRGGDRRVTLNGVQVTTGGDVIVRIGAHAVRSSADVSRIIAAELRPGETVRVLVLRDGKQLGFDITVGERPLVRG